MGLFGISRELQFGGCNHGEPQASLHMSRKEECFHREEKEVGRATVNKEFMAFHWLVLVRKEEVSLFFLLGSAVVVGCENSLFYSPNSI